jgi:cell division protein FtsL
MRSAVTGLTVILTLASAFLLYVVSFDTRQLELEVQADELLRERLAGEIAVLKADWAYLSRPSRLEPAARQIGMRPATVQQSVRLEELPLRRATSANAPALATGR